MLTSNGGRFFNRVLSDLAEIGYDAEWTIISAESVGAPHRRERVWIIAYPNVGDSQSNGGDTLGKVWQGKEPVAGGICGDVAYPQSNDAGGETGELRETERRQGGALYGELGGTGRTADLGNAEHARRDAAEIGGGVEPRGNNRKAGEVETREPSGSGVEREDVADLHDPRLQGAEETGNAQGEGPERNEQSAGRDWWTVEPRLGQLAHGLPSGLDLAGLENEFIRVARNVPERVNQLKGLGNAIVPQCAEVILRRIKCELVKVTNAGQLTEGV